MSKELNIDGPKKNMAEFKQEISEARLFLENSRQSFISLGQDHIKLLKENDRLKQRIKDLEGKP